MRDLTAWFGKPVCRIGKQVIGYVPPAYSVLIQCCLRQAAFYAAFIFFVRLYTEDSVQMCNGCQSAISCLMQTLRSVHVLS